MEFEFFRVCDVTFLKLPPPPQIVSQTVTFFATPPPLPPPPYERDVIFERPLKTLGKLSFRESPIHSAP